MSFRFEQTGFDIQAVVSDDSLRLGVDEYKCSLAKHLRADIAKVGANEILIRAGKAWQEFKSPGEFDGRIDSPSFLKS